MFDFRFILPVIQTVQEITEDSSISTNIANNAVVIAGAIVGLIITTIAGLRSLIPSIMDGYRKNNELKIMQSEAKAIANKKQEEIESESVAYLNEFARQRIQSAEDEIKVAKEEIVRLRDGEKVTAVTIAEFRIKDTLREEEISRLRQDLKSNNEMFTQTNTKLAETHVLVVKLTAEIEILRERTNELEKKLEAERKLNDMLEKELAITRAELIAKNEQLEVQRARYRELENVLSERERDIIEIKKKQNNVQ